MSASNSLDMISKLISFDTTSRYSNMELISYIQEYLNGLGVASTLVPNEDQSKASLYATVGPDDVPGVMLSGTPTSSPLMARNGIRTHSASLKKTASFMVAARPI